MGKVSVVIGLLIIAISLEGKSDVKVFREGNLGVKIKSYSREVSQEVVENKSKISKKTYDSPTADLY